jgi:hypothetical protein
MALQRQFQSIFSTIKGALYLKELLHGLCQKVELIKTTIEAMYIQQQYSKSVSLILGIFEDEEKVKSE